MVDTLRNLEDTLALLPVQLAGQVGVQDVRDAIASMAGWHGEIGSSADSQNVANHGADPLGVSDSSPGIQAAIDAAGASGKPSNVYFPTGVYRFNTGITMPYDNQTWIVHGTRFIPVSGFSGTVVTIGSRTAATVRRYFRCIGSMFIEQTDFSTGRLWDSKAIGVEFLNCNTAHVDRLIVNTCYIGVRLRGTNGHGCVDNEIHIARLQNNWTGLSLQSDDGGWVQSNTMIGGQIALQTGVPNGSGILQTAINGYPIKINARPLALDVADATAGTPVEVETNIAHGLDDGDTVTIAGITGGVLEANVAASTQITKTGQKTFTLDGITGTGVANPNTGTVSPDEPARTGGAMHTNSFYGLNLEGNSGITPTSARWPYGIFLNGANTMFHGRFELGTPDTDDFGRNIYVDTELFGKGSHFFLSEGELSAADNLFEGDRYNAMRVHGTAGTAIGVRPLDGVPALTLPLTDSGGAAQGLSIKDAAGATLMKINEDNVYDFSGLPTSDPGVAGELWVDTGDSRRVKSSAG